MADDISMSLDVRQLRTAAKMFRETIPKEVRTPMLAEVRKVGRKIADEATATARFKVEGKPLSVRTAGASVTIRVQKNEPKPHRGKAHAFENAGDPGSFRHPVFGHRSVWKDQTARPFLTPTAEARHDWAAQQIGDVVDRAMRSAGFR